MSLRGRKAVNQNSGEATATAMAHHAIAGSPESSRYSANSSHTSAAPARALKTARPRTVDAGMAATLSTPFESFASAMKTGYPGGCG